MWRYFIWYALIFRRYSTMKPMRHTLSAKTGYLLRVLVVRKVAASFTVMSSDGLLTTLATRLYCCWVGDDFAADFY